MAIQRVNIANLQQTETLVDPQGRPSPSFLRFLNNSILSLKNGVNSLIDLQNAIDAANALIDTANAAIVVANDAADTATAAAATNLAEASIVNSFVTGCTVTGSDAGANATISITAHTRVYGDGTSVAVSAGAVTGLAYSTFYFIYYDQPSRAGGAVTYVATTSDVTAGQTGNRHLVGSTTTPAALAAPTPGKTVKPSRTIDLR